MPARDAEPQGTEGETRPVLYCVVPRDLARSLHEPVRRHFASDPSVEVIVERREAERRVSRERRAGQRSAPSEERRRVRNLGGRRVGDRRAAGVRVEARALPRKARVHAGRIAFVERLEPSEQHAIDLDTARLVIRFQAGEQDAFARIYERYFGQVYSYLRLFLTDPGETEETTQQIFLQVLEALPRYERREVPFRAWLFRIVRNQALDELERRSRVDVVDPEEMRAHRERDPEEAVLQSFSWISDRELLLFIERLPLAQRQVLALRFMLGLSTSQIANVLGRNEEAVRALQSRALRFLRARLSAVGHSAADRHEQIGSLAVKRQVPVVRLRRYALVLPGSAR